MASSLSSSSTSLIIHNYSTIAFNSSGNLKCVDLSLNNNVVQIKESNIFGGLLIKIANTSAMCVTNNYNNTKYGCFCSQFGGIPAQTVSNYVTITLPSNTMCFITIAGGVNSGSPGNTFQTVSFFVCTVSTLQSTGSSICTTNTGITANYNPSTNTFTMLGNTNFPLVYSVWCVGPVV
jgi:hypothetical protein